MKRQIQKVLIVAAGVILLGIVAGMSLSLAQNAGHLIKITTASEVNRFSGNADLSGDGTHLAFASNSDLLGQGITQDEIWLYDTQMMTYTRITTATTTKQNSNDPSLNSDGTKIAFESDADLLGEDLPADQYEIWLYDTQTMTYTRITTAIGSDIRASLNPSMSSDGTKLAFNSNSQILGADIEKPDCEIGLYDLATKTLSRVTRGNDGWDRCSQNPSLSANGQIIAFESDADFLNQAIPDNQYEIWLYDTQAMTYTRITTASNQDSWNPSLSGNGKRVVFESDADFLNQGIPDFTREIWLYDTTTLTYTRITTATGNGYRASLRPRLSADGKWVVFHSTSDLLNQGIPEEQSEIWLYNVESRQYTRITTSGADRASESPTLSANGLKIAFHSDADFLNQSSPDNQFEIWLYDGTPFVYLPLVMK